MWFVVLIVFSEVEITISCCVLATDAHEAALLVWNIESHQKFHAAEEARLRQTILIKQISNTELGATWSCVNDFKDLGANYQT